MDQLLVELVELFGCIELESVALATGSSTYLLKAVAFVLFRLIIKCNSFSLEVVVMTWKALRCLPFTITPVHSHACSGR